MKCLKKLEYCQEGTHPGMFICQGRGHTYYDPRTPDWFGEVVIYTDDPTVYYLSGTTVEIPI